MSKAANAMETAIAEMADTYDAVVETHAVIDDAPDAPTFSGRRHCTSSATVGSEFIQGQGALRLTSNAHAATYRPTL
jgi:hypothetical protein